MRIKNRKKKELGQKFQSQVAATKKRKRKGPKKRRCGNPYGNGIPKGSTVGQMGQPAPEKRYYADSKTTEPLPLPNPKRADKPKVKKHKKKKHKPHKQVPPKPHRDIAVEKTDNQKAHAAYIRSAPWRKRRKIYIATYPNCACLVCNKPERVQLHHITYDRLEKEWFKDIVPLCSKHHDELHACHKRYRIKLALENFRDALAKAFGFSLEKTWVLLERYDALPDGPILPDSETLSWQTPECRVE